MCELILKNGKLKPDSHHSCLIITAYTLAGLFLNSVIPTRCSFRFFFSFLLIFKWRFCSLLIVLFLKILHKWGLLEGPLHGYVCQIPHPSRYIHTMGCRPLGRCQPKSSNNSSVRAVVPLSSFSSAASVYAASCDISINIFATDACAFQLRLRVSLQLWCRHTIRRFITLTFVMLNIGYVYLVCLQEDNS